MKLAVHTSMRWIQQNLRYLAYMEDHGREGQPPLSRPLPKPGDELETGLREAGRTDSMEAGKVMDHH